ncbi:MAG: bifunctional chorismate mutase/prephenate dehydratase [Clostridiales bacterium]|nr:bifunctional chorismate mutase/prephenate dehydratase [Clostridiales bacterium]
MELSRLRTEIDHIDTQMLDLFLSRMACAKEVAGYKAEHGLPVQNTAREREILAWATEKSGDMERYTHRFFTTLFELSRSYQAALNAVPSKLRAHIDAALERGRDAFPQTGTVACQGVEGAYSQMAADKLLPRGNIVYFKTFEAVFDAVERGLCQFGVLPIENSSNGSVRAVYDLLQQKNVSIVRSARLYVKHELLAKPGTRPEDITEIYSHEQALGQCSGYLKGLGDRVKVIPCDNTAAAAKLAAEGAQPGVAAISSHNCGRLYGLTPVCTDIQNSDNNYTRFICIAKEPVTYPGANRISLILACEHKPGALYGVLAHLAALGVNIMKLESCPIAGHDFEFMFFLEMEASVTDPRTVSMLEALERSCEQLFYLGNYLEV